MISILTTNTATLRSKKFWACVLIAALFFLFRLPGLDLPYHQDEWKNVNLASSVEIAGGFFTHPPLMQMMFVLAYKVFGIEWFRLFPLVFSTASLVLLYRIVRNRAGTTAGLWAATLFALCAYNIQGALSPDVDGAILPFFFLLSFWAYDMWRLASYKLTNKWFYILVASLLLGFLIKLNFILVIGVFGLEYIITHWKSLSIKRLSSIVGVSLGFGALYVVLLYFIQWIYPAFSIAAMLSHADESGGGLGRNWTQIIVQAAKAVYFLSPLLVVAPFLVMSREVFVKMRPFFIYLIAGFVFYFIAFDFSRAALDKYLLFSVVPLAAIVGTGLVGLCKNFKLKEHVVSIIAGVVVSLILVALLFVHHSVVPLYPKEEWFSKVFHGEWNILNPFIGGNGPMGFYMSFLFIVVSFIISAVLVLVGMIQTRWKVSVAVIVVIMGIFYNAAFAEEFLLGKVYGSGPDTLSKAVKYIAGNDAIKHVLTYNDTGAGPLSLIGKYAGRIYAIPDAEEGYRKKFSEFDGQYMVIDIPHLYESGFYGRFFAQCEVLFESRSGTIVGRVYDCSEAKKIISTI